MMRLAGKIRNIKPEVLALILNMDIFMPFNKKIILFLIIIIDKNYITTYKHPLIYFKFI